MTRILKWIGVLLGAFVLVIGILFGYWYLRPNRAFIAESLAMESWNAVSVWNKSEDWTGKIR